MFKERQRRGTSLGTEKNFELNEFKKHLFLNVGPTPTQSAQDKESYSGHRLMGSQLKGLFNLLESNLTRFASPKFLFQT